MSYVYYVRNAFIVKGSDKVYVDVYCGKYMLKICVLGVEPLHIPRRFGKIFDKFITRIVTTRGKPLECHEYRVRKAYIIGLKRLRDDVFIVVDVDNMFKIFFREDKIEHVKKCLKAIRGS